MEECCRLPLAGESTTGCAPGLARGRPPPLAHAWASFGPDRTRGRAPPPAVGSASTRRAYHAGGLRGSDASCKERIRPCGREHQAPARRPRAGAPSAACGSTCFAAAAECSPAARAGSELRCWVRELDLRRRVQSCCWGTMGKNRGSPLLSVNEEEGGGCTGGEARHLLAWTSLANWRWPNLAFPWSQAKRPIWLAVAWLRRLAKQPNMGWVAYGSLVGG